VTKPPNKSSSKQRVIVVGGGAAGFFAAIACAEADPSCQVTILERTAEVLSKVKISGGGRCNVTHACFDPARLVTFYPRGGRALRGPFSRFQPQDTVDWFQSRGVALKTEEDGRIFPVSDQSQTIIDCLTQEAARAGVTVTRNVLVERIERARGKGFKLILKSGESMETDTVIMATGSSPIAWTWAESLGHTIASPVPSLFTFTITDPRLDDLAGLSVPAAELSVEGLKLRQAGPLLITHTGVSGPAVLKLSAWGARPLHDRKYHFSLHVNWLREPLDPLVERLSALRKKHAANLILAHNIRDLPRRLWARLCVAAGIKETTRWSDVTNPLLRALAFQITDGVFIVTGRSPFKEEFVTCGGVNLDEVDFRTMESKRCPGLYFAGEVLDVDALTGGFNFQSAWTTGWIAGRSVAGRAQIGP
jgi:predicted Rossmann fold flavoprotein